MAVDQFRAGLDDLHVGVVLAPGGEVGDRVAGGVDSEAAHDTESDRLNDEFFLGVAQVGAVTVGEVNERVGELVDERLDLVVG